MWLGWETLSQEERDKLEGQKIREYMLGNEAAALFIGQVFYIIHLWDDLVDDDQHRPIEDINRAFWFALVEIPRNPFFNKHSYFLTSQYQLLISQWMNSNDLIHDGANDEKLQRAFILKDTSIDLIAQCAFLIGGYDHMRKVSLELQELLLL